MAVLLGVVEGLTEFLPVSSTAHLRIVEALLGMDLGDPYWKTFTIVIQLGAVLCLPIWTLFMLIGTLIWAYYQISHEALPAFIDKPDKVFPYFVATKIPVGIAGVFMAALFSAAMSMLS